MRSRAHAGVACRSVFVVSCVVLSCGRRATQAPVTHDWLIVPGERIGPVAATTSEQDLIQLLGPASVTRREISIGEGVCAPGTVLFAGTPDAVNVMWMDSGFAKPATVEVTGRGSQWRTPAGLRVGIELTELESLAAGTPVEFSGFGWDYGGMGSWSEQTPEGRGEVMIGLAPDSASLELVQRDPRYSEIMGEQTVRSDHPLIREMTIEVERIAIRWGDPTIQRQCQELTSDAGGAEPSSIP